MKRKSTRKPHNHRNRRNANHAVTPSRNDSGRTEYVVHVGGRDGPYSFRTESREELHQFIANVERSAIAGTLLDDLERLLAEALAGSILRETAQQDADRGNTHG